LAFISILGLVPYLIIFEELLLFEPTDFAAALKDCACYNLRLLRSIFIIFFIGGFVWLLAMEAFAYCVVRCLREVKFEREPPPLFDELKVLWKDRCWILADLGKVLSYGF
jgi:hypothetical protein